FAYNVDVTSLLAASGVLAIMLGFALQTVMADFFASISMQMTRPYSLGDWIKVGEKEGKVEHIDWRATVLRTMYDDYLILPNNKLAHEAIINVSQPTNMHFHAIPLRTPVQYAPARVQAVVRAALAGAEHVHHERGYAVYLDGFDESVLVWRVKFWISEYRLWPHIETDVRSRIWYAFQRAGMELPTADRNVVLRQPATDEVRSSALRLFSRIDWLAALSAEDRDHLADRVRLVRYGPEETIVRQGDAGESLFVIWQGTVEIRARHADGTVFMRKTLGSGDFFGEISLLTGEPRSADVVALEDAALLVLDKEALRKVVTDDAELISRLLARRQELSREREDSITQTVPADDGATDGKSQRSVELFRKIRDFFAI
ncbi:MAG TPA: mechanosensitive ion channel family protein, partial [Candidatus Xenobia bacterium]